MAEERKQQEPSPITGPGIPILPEEKALYFNGFAIAVGSGDIVMTLMRNGVPSLTLNASFTVAKTFGESLVASIRKLEEVTHHEIMTVQDVTTSTTKLNSIP
jgi:hypothetical protein